MISARPRTAADRPMIEFSSTMLLIIAPCSMIEFFRMVFSITAS